MTRRVVRTGLVVVLVLATGVTVLAQRGGGFGRWVTPTYMPNTPYDGQFMFVRMSYPFSGRQLPPWSHDYPEGEVHFMKILTAVSSVAAHVAETNISSFSDPEMFKYPLIYLCEPGYWRLSQTEAVALHDYLAKGGFLIVDDFPEWAWSNFDLQMSGVFPQAHWEELTAEHPVFHSFFNIDSLDIIPQYYMRGRPVFRALFEDNDSSKRMLVMVNYNTDISEFWEWSETGYRPVDENNEAYKLGVNEFIYGMTH